MSGPCSVLLIEDDAGERGRVRRLVATHGGGRVLLQEAASMDEGLRLLKTDRFRLVLLDHTLPRGPALDELRQVRASQPELPILMHTGYISPNDEETVPVEGIREVVKGSFAPLWAAILRACPEFELPDAVEVVPNSACTILVVEDDGDVRAMVQRVLHDAGYGVVTAENGQRALDLLSTLPESVDLVFTDVRMPAMSGPAMARVLSESKPDLPVIYTSGWLEEQDPATSQLPPRSSLLPKPFMPGQLLESVATALRRAGATD